MIWWRDGRITGDVQLNGEDIYGDMDVNIYEKE